MSENFWSGYYAEQAVPAATSPPESLPIAPTVDVAFGTVTSVLDWGRNLTVRVEDGRMLEVTNALFRGIRRGDRVVAFGTRTGWSLIDRRWSGWPAPAVAKALDVQLEALRQVLTESFFLDALADGDLIDEEQLQVVLERYAPSKKKQREVQNLRLWFGKTVEFKVTAVDPEMLQGHVLEGEVPAVLPREYLPFPKNLPEFDGSAFVGKTLQCRIAAPDVRPVQVACVDHRRWRAEQGALNSRSETPETPETLIPRFINQPEQFLHLALVVSHFRQLEAVVDVENEEGWWLRLNGVSYVFLPRAEWSWSVATRPPDFGQRVRIRAWPDLVGFQLVASARVLDEPGAQRVRVQNPPGARWQRARRRDFTASGTVFDYEVAQTRVAGVLPSVIRGSDTTRYYPPHDIAPEQDLVVVSFDEDRGRFLLCSPHEVKESDRPRIGELRPIRVVLRSSQSGRLIVRWSTYYPAIEATLGDSDCLAARVASVENVADDGTPSLRLLPNVANWEVVRSSTPEEVVLRWPLTSATLVATINTPAPLVAGQKVWISWSSVVLAPDGAKVHGRRCHEPGRFGVGDIVTAQIVEAVKGGCNVVLEDCSYFVPAAQLDVIPPKDFDEFVGKTHKFLIIKIAEDKMDILLSRRAAIEQERGENRQKFLEGVKVGDIVQGSVKNLTDFGAFIDLDGMDGLLHITDMTWGRLGHPSELLKVGQQLEVVVLDINREKERISLGLKQTQKNPWDQIEERFRAGQHVKGKITNLVPYGAFVELEEGVEGLIHVSELSWTKRNMRPSDVLTAGQEVEAVVLGVNKEEQKISLGLRQLEPSPWDEIEKKFTIGSHVKGVIRKMAAYGAFVELEDGVDGMIHVSDLSWTRKINPSEMFKKNDEVEAVVIDIDKVNQRISLGIKQLSDDPWKEIDSKYKIGDLVTSKVTKLASFGAFVQLQDDIDGLVHISELREDHVVKVKDVFKVGQEVEARVIKVDKVERRIGLSIKGLEREAKTIQLEYAAMEPAVATATSAATDTSATAPLPSSVVRKTAQPPVSSARQSTGAAERCVAMINEGKITEGVEQLDEADYAALISFAAIISGENPGPRRWPAVETWARLAALCAPRTELTSAGATIASLEAVLRSLASNSGEIALHAALAEMLPRGFLARHHTELASWLRIVATDGAAAARSGIALIRALAAEDEGDLSRAFHILNDLADESTDPTLAALRSRLIGMHEKAINDPAWKFGDYRRVPEEVVLRGGFSYVIPVVGPDGRRLALKQLRLCRLSPIELAGMTDLFQREAGILSRAHHPNIVRYERQLAPGAFLIEWVTGRPLDPGRDGSHGGPGHLGGKDGIGDPAGWWTLSRVIDFGRQVAGALNHLNEVFGRFVHNDVTPRNLMINQAAAGTGTAVWVKLIDFGLGCSPEFSSISTLIDEAGVRLRESYRAPETRLGVFDDPRSDMYSLGAILFQLCGRRLLRSPHPTDDAGWADAVPAEEVRRWAPAPFAAFVLRLVATEPDLRPASWAEAEATLSSLLKNGNLRP